MYLYTTTPLSKPALRRELKRRRAAVPPDERARAAAIASEILFAEPCWRTASVVHLYSSFGDEFPTDALRRAAFAGGKRAFAPVTPPDAAPRLLHVEVFPDTQFVPDAFGIPTPVPTDVPLRGGAPLTLDELLSVVAPDVVIAPLLGFDAALQRVGYGKGYYDRFLAELRNRELPKPPLIVGVAFYAAQFWDAPLPAEAHDQPLDCVITERGVSSKWL